MIEFFHLPVSIGAIDIMAIILFFQIFKRFLSLSLVFLQ